MFSGEIACKLQNENLRCELDLRSEKVNYKIFQAQTKKIPYMIIVGEKEKESNKVSVRKFGQKQTKEVSLMEFLASIKGELEL